MEFLEGILYMLWRGLAIGVIISAPMGPVGILCVQRTLEKGRTTGFFTGVGAALSDLFYCLVTGFGLSFIEDFLKANQNAIQIIGSIVLVVFGVYLFRSNPARTLRKPEASRYSRRRDVLQGFLFTFSNPLIIFLIIGLFARFNFLLPEITLSHYITGFTFIFIGALLWWWLVSFFVDKVRSHFNLRSMWLINKFIGFVIMVFALVGIITALSGMASARGRAPVYMNSQRGFSLLGDSVGRGKPLVIRNAGPDTLTHLFPLDNADDFSFTFRVSNLNNREGKRYTYRRTDGSMAKVSHPAWGLVVTGGGHRLELLMSTSDDTRDELGLTLFNVRAILDGELYDRVGVTSGISLFEGVNSIRFRRDAGTYTLLGGDREYVPLLAVDAPVVMPDSVGFLVSPGGALSLDYMTVCVSSERMPDPRLGVSHFADGDVRESYFSRSVDPIEGEWEIYDRTFEDTRLKPGGDYHLAVVSDSNGYRLIYLSGAHNNVSSWIAGMEKGRLSRTSFPDVFDVCWLDPAGHPLEGEIKAQFTAPDILTMQFVDHESTLRLRKKKAYGKR